MAESTGEKGFLSRDCDGTCGSFVEKYGTLYACVFHGENAGR